MTPSLIRSAGQRIATVLLAGGLLGLPVAAIAQGDSGKARLEVKKQAPYGDYITDRAGHSLYMFEQDTQGQPSSCTDACANTDTDNTTNINPWPPYVTDREPEAGKGIDKSLIGTAKREDGTTQVTYGGWPLYYFNGDKRSGDALGQGVEHLGAPWYLVSPEGKPIRQGGPSEAPDIKEHPSKGKDPASEGQEIHQQIKDNPGQADDA